jgi:hypothetical protein
MFATLVIIATFNGVGYQPNAVQTYAVPATECESAKAQIPQRKGWITTAFCTPGGDPALNPKPVKP